MRQLIPLLLLLAGAMPARADTPVAPREAVPGGIFVGTTPCDAAVRRFLALRAREKCDFIRWDLWVALGVNGHSNKLIAKVEYGASGGPLRKLERTGDWAVGVGMPEHPDANIYAISIGKRNMALWRVTGETVHFLDADRRLLAGNASWGYSLSIAIGLEPRERSIPTASTQAGRPYKLLPLANGKDVFDVFEGRTPCALGQVVGIKADAACSSLDWRLTLFADPATRGPANYRLEGSLFPDGAREGAVSLRPGTPFDFNARVLMLEPPLDKEPVYLMRGDDNVLYFLDQAGRLGLGNRDFGYTLNRRRN
jgi:hypothetical protein